MIAQDRVSETITIPAPNSGLNSRSPLSNMPVEFAIQMTNLIATPVGVENRKGSTEWTTGFLSPLRSIIPYNSGSSATSKLFTADDEHIYDVSEKGGNDIVATGITSGKFRYAQLATQGGNFLILANGVNDPRIYNGTTWITTSSVASPAAVGEFHLPSGYALSGMRNPTIHQRRIWFVYDNSTRIFYSEINSLGGELKSFDLGGNMPRGGKVVDLISWTSGVAGTGLSNRLAVITSEGDCIVFDGTDPDDAASWQVSGVFALSKPAYDQPFMIFGGDVLYWSKTGVYPLSLYLQNGNLTVPLSNNISATIGEMSRNYTNIHGFDICDVDSEDIVIFNMPQISSSGNLQFCFQKTTGGWSLFTGIPAIAWAELNGVPFFITASGVYRAFVGYKDLISADGSGGKSYTCVVQQSFTTLGASGQNKHIKLIRANLLSKSTTTNLRINVRTDFDTSAPLNVSNVASIPVSLWDAAEWDAAFWSSEISAISKWNGASAYGVYISPILLFQASDQTIWTSSDLVFEPAGIL